MLSKIQQLYSDCVNNKPREVCIKKFFKFCVSSLACASLAQRLWITADQLNKEPQAREKVFQAGQRLFALVTDQREVTVSSFTKANEVGALVLGLISATLAIKAIKTIWKYRVEGGNHE